jgi:hypothetical protein
MSDILFQSLKLMEVLVYNNKVLAKDNNFVLKVGHCTAANENLNV